MLDRQWMQVQLGLGKDLFHQLAEASVEAAAAAALLGKDEAAPIDVLSQPQFLVGRELRRLAARDEQDRRLQQVLDRGLAGVDHLIGQILPPDPLDVADQVEQRAAVMDPILLGPVPQMGQHDWPLPLRQKQQCEAGREQRVGLALAFGPGAGEHLFLDQHLGPFAVPIVLADEPPGRHSPGPLQAVQIIKQPNAARAGIAIDRKIPGQPVQAVFDRLVRLLLAAAEQLIALDLGVAGIGLAQGDDHRGDARVGHAAGPLVAGLVAPRAVRILLRPPVFQGPGPDRVVDRHAHLFGLVEGQHGELGIRVVAAGGAGIRVGPGTLAIAVLHLSAFQPLDVLFDEEIASLGIGGAKDHRLQRDRVGRGRPEVAQVIERALDGLVVGAAAAAQEGQRAERRQAAVIDRRVVGPAAAVAAALGLFLFEKLDPALDRLGDLLGGDSRGLVGRQRADK